MASINEILSIGKGGMSVSKALLSIAGKNMANVNTPGYSRELIALESQPYASLGVRVSGPHRVTNPFLSDSLRNITGDLGFYNGQLIPLNAIEPAVNDLDGTGLGQALSTFHGALQETTANPSSEVQRMALLEATEFLAQSFRNTSEQLVDSAEKTRDQAEATAIRVTSLAKDLAKLNKQIMVLDNHESPPNVLKDTRSQMLLELSNLIDIDVLDTNDGSISVFIAGGRPLVDHTLASSVKVTPSDPPTGTPAVIEIRKPNGQELKAMGATGGSLGGLLEAHNEVIVTSMEELDAMAFGMIEAFNTQHKAGFDLNGDVGGNFFTALGSVTGAAALISVSTDIQDQPDKIAGSSILGEVPGNNTNLQELLEIQSDSTALGTGRTIMEAWFDIQVNVGSALSAARLGSDAELASQQQISNLLAAEVGVSIDEELITMNRANQAYEASGALIRAAEKMSTVLLNLVR
jgi:flagellar hook-associated protein 1 FlgK